MITSYFTYYNMQWRLSEFAVSNTKETPHLKNEWQSLLICFGMDIGILIVNLYEVFIEVISSVEMAHFQDRPRKLTTKILLGKGGGGEEKRESHVQELQTQSDVDPNQDNPHARLCVYDICTCEQ
jgi:hypothetical protein